MLTSLLLWQLQTKQGRVGGRAEPGGWAEDSDGVEGWARRFFLFFLLCFILVLYSDFPIALTALNQTGEGGWQGRTRQLGGGRWWGRALGRIREYDCTCLLEQLGHCRYQQKSSTPVHSPCGNGGRSRSVPPWGQSVMRQQG